MPVIVTSSHSWPMVNLLDQVQLGMVCVQVKSFPFWTTSVTTLWSVLALRSPAAVEFKLMTIHMYPFMAYVSIRKSVYQSLPETPHNCLDSPAHISQRKTWWWKRRDEVSKEFIRQKKKKQEWPAADTVFLLVFEWLPTSASSFPLTSSCANPTRVWKMSAVILPRQFVRLLYAKML